MTNRLPQMREDPKAVREYLHHLHDTLVLLGADTRFADALSNPAAITEADVADLRGYNMRLIDATKDKLVGINQSLVVPRDQHPQ